MKARIQKQLEATGSTTVEEVLPHLLETREESRGTWSEAIQYRP